MKNSAARLHSILQAAASAAGKRTVTDLWVDVFQIDASKYANVQMEVAQRLIWLSAEAEALVAYLRDDRKQPEKAYAPIHNAVWHAGSMTLLAAQPGSVQQRITPDVLATLFSHSLYLPDEEVAISKENLEMLEQLLTSLESLAKDASIGAYLDDVLKRHIRLLRRAIDAYPIWGIRAFADSLRDALGDLFMVGEYQKRGGANASPSNAEQSVYEQLCGLWRKVSTVAGEVDKVRKVGLLGYYGYEAVERFLHHQS